MSPLTISAFAFVIIFGGALGGMALRRLLAEKLSSDAKDAVRLSMGLIGTIAALVLGLLIASAKTSYDGKVTKLREIAVNVILSDTLLEQYGDDALPARRLLRATVDTTIDRIWGDPDPKRAGPFDVQSGRACILQGGRGLEAGERRATRAAGARAQPAH